MSTTTVNFTGTSGRQYAFEVYPAETEFNDVSAVYIFTKRTVSDGKGAHKAIYIGEAEKLGERIAGHEKWPCAKQNGATHICVHVVEGATNRVPIETDVRNNYSTPCNEQ